MDIRSELRNYIEKSLLSDGSGAVSDDETLIESGRIDSMGLIKLLGFIQQKYGIDLMNVAGPDDLQSIATIADALSRQLVSR